MNQVGRTDEGLAVPLVVVLILALTVLGYGALALATVQGRAARAARDHLEARLLAEGAARSLERRLRQDSMPRVPLWTEAPLDQGRAEEFVYGAGLLALGPEWHLVVGWSRRGATGARARAAWTLWALDPVVRVAGTPAVVEHGEGLDLGLRARVDASGLRSPDPGGTPSVCAPYLAALDSLAPSLDLRPTAAGEGRGRLADGELGLGPLGWDDLPERLDPQEPGSVRPFPVADGDVCLAQAPDNWGSPSDPRGPCGNLRVSLFVQGDLRIPAGEGQGFLAVDGSLHVDDALFAGVLVVRDTLVLGGGGRVAGLVKVGGPVVLEDGARVEGRACAAALALARAEALRHPLSLEERPWVRPFGTSPPPP